MKLQPREFPRKCKFADFSPAESPRQLVGYLDHLKLPEGWMAIFDDDQSKPWDEKIYIRDEIVDGKTIHFIGL